MKGLVHVRASFNAMVVLPSITAPATLPWQLNYVQETCIAEFRNPDSGRARGRSHVTRPEAKSTEIWPIPNEIGKCGMEWVWLGDGRIGRNDD